MEKYIPHHLASRKKDSLVAQLRGRLFALPFEHKLVGLGALVTMIGCFMPWAHFSGVGNMSSIYYNGFQNITFMVGYVVFGLALTSLVSVVASMFDIRALSFVKPFQLKLHVLAGAQTFFLALITYSIYASFYQIRYSSTSYIREGISVIFIGSILMLVGTYFEKLAKKRDQKKKTYLQMDDMEDEASKLLSEHNMDRQTTLPMGGTIPSALHEELPQEEETPMNMPM